MTQEEKELLLKDLCARLPYGVLCKSGNKILPLKDVYIDGTVGNEGQLRLGNCKYGGIYKSIEKIKHYLRPMSSMTEEEKEIYHSLCHSETEIEKDFQDGEDEYIYTYYDTVKSIDWLIANHFDYHRLIPMGLALEAPEGMYNK